MAATQQNLAIGHVNREKALRVIQMIREGKAAKEALTSVGLAPQSFADLLNRERELSVMYARAQEIRADVLADEVIAIADDRTIDPQRARNMIDARRWRAKTLNPKTYGERIDLNVTQTVDILGTLEAARARVMRPVIDQPQDIEDVTPIESSTYEQGATDKQSVCLDNPAPDIFS